MTAPDILLTNDDGVDSEGLYALYDALSSLGSVTVVAPAEDQSAVGRSLSESVEVADHERGHVVDGTPADCVVAGLRSLVPDADLVVSGCNTGANLGTAVLGRSGTVSAAVESAFLGVPAIAVSMYIPAEQFAGGKPALDREAFAEAASVTKYLAEHARSNGVFDHADYLNVNLPAPDREAAEMVLTRPSNVYRMDTEASGESLAIRNRIWDQMAEGSLDDPPGTDRRAIADGKVSVTPLEAHHTEDLSADFAALLSGYNESRPTPEG